LEQEEIENMLKVINEQKPQTVAQLVELARTKLNVPENEIIETVLRLQNEGKIRLARPVGKTPQKLTEYLRTGNANWYWATIILSIATAATAFTIPENLFPLVFVRYVLGAIFVLWLPGYSFIKALFPTESPLENKSRDLDTIERIALSIGLSLALVPIIGLLLNYTPWGIRLTPIVLSLLATTIIFSTVALAREHQIKTKVNKENW